MVIKINAADAAADVARVFIIGREDETTRERGRNPEVRWSLSDPWGTTNYKDLYRVRCGLDDRDGVIGSAKAPSIVRGPRGPENQKTNFKADLK